MKKQYINPVTSKFLVSPLTFIAASGDGTSTETIPGDGGLGLDKEFQ